MSWRWATLTSSFLLPVVLTDIVFLFFPMKVNPLAGLTPNFSDLPMIAKAYGLEYDQLIGLIINSALKRYKSLSHVASKLVS